MNIIQQFNVFKSPSVHSIIVKEKFYINHPSDANLIEMMDKEIVMLGTIR